MSYYTTAARVSDHSGGAGAIFDSAYSTIAPAGAVYEELIQVQQLQPQHVKTESDVVRRHSDSLVARLLCVIVLCHSCAEHLV